MSILRGLSVFLDSFLSFFKGNLGSGAEEDFLFFEGYRGSGVLDPLSWRLSRDRRQGATLSQNVFCDPVLVFA